MTPREAPRRARAGAAVAALVHVAAERLLAARPPGGAARWERTNYAGRTVSLTGGAATALAVVAGSAAAGGRAGAAAALAGAAGGAAGLVDDLGEDTLPVLLGRRPGRHAAEPAPASRAAKGLRGHLGALREGRVTTGALKIAAIGAGALAAACVLPGPGRDAAAPAARPVRRGAGRAVDVGLSTVVIAGTANLLNLLDLRPGRALKAGLIGAAPLLAAGAAPAPRAAATGPASAVLGAASAALHGDLRERTMLGDTGANALGAALGTALAAGTAPAPRAALAAGIVALTLASEKVSFSAVIARTPVLRELDALGRA